MKLRWIFLIYSVVLALLSGGVFLWFSKQPKPFIDKTGSAGYKEKIAKLDQIDPIAFQAMERKILGSPSVKIVSISREEMNTPPAGAVYKGSVSDEKSDDAVDPDVCTDKNPSENCKWVNIKN